MLLRKLTGNLSYRSIRYSLIKSYEGINGQVHFDSANPPIPTIGPGFNIRLDDKLAAVLNVAFGISTSVLGSPGRLLLEAMLLVTRDTSLSLADIQLQLDTLLQNHFNDPSLSFELDATQMRTVFERLAVDFEQDAIPNIFLIAA